MYQFFVKPEQISGKTICITGGDVNHIKNVLRMKPGEELAVSNGTDGKEYRCQIREMTAEAVICTLLFVKEDGLELPSRVYLFQGLPKGDKMDLIVQKAVELGVFQIIPVAARRSVVKLDEKKAKSRLARWQGIAEAAAKQSKRRIVPEIASVMTMKEAAAYARDMECKLIPYELAEGMGRTKTLISQIIRDQRVAVFIGPEGGFEDSEIETARAAGIEPVTMGKRILRTETAGLTMLAWIMYQLEEEA
ncbi:16S rRNA (uracil(1498)-N(3))-methyltransferase [Lachnospiraceae bacterium JLR.KK008]